MIPILLISILFIWFKLFVTNPAHSSLITLMEAFTVGALIGDVFFHSLPHIIADVQGCENSVLGYFWMFSFGIILSYLIEVATNRFSGHEHEHHDHHAHGQKQPTQKVEHEHKVQTSPVVSLIGDFTHNITDGVMLAVTFNYNLTLGIATTIAIFFHEIPHEIGDFAFLYKRGVSFLKVILFQIITGLGALLGCYLGLLFGEKYQVEGVLIASGGFTYMALCVFFEDMRHKKSLGQGVLNAGFIFIGLFFMYVIAVLE